MTSSDKTTAAGYAAGKRMASDPGGAGAHALHMMEQTKSAEGRASLNRNAEGSAWWWTGAREAYEKYWPQYAAQRVLAAGGKPEAPGGVNEH